MDKETISTAAMQNLFSANIQQRRKLTDWKNEPTAEDLLGDLQKAQSSHQNQVGKINEWVSLLYADTDKSKIKQGRSGITPKVIRRLAEWRYGALSTSFLNERKLFQVQASSPTYLAAAIQNELVLNFQFNALIDKVKFVNDLVRSAVNEGTAIIRVGWETETQIKEEEIPVYVYVTPTMEEAYQLTLIMEQISQDVQANGLETGEDSEVFKNLDPVMQESLLASYERGMPVIAQDTGKTQIKKTEVQTRNRPAVKVIPNSSLIIDPTCEGDFDKARFAIYSFTTSLSELKQAGFEDVEKTIGDIETQQISQNVLGMDDKSFNHLEETIANGFQFKDSPRKRLQAYEYWGYYDIDGTGVVQAIVATIVNKKVLKIERSPFPDNKLPFVVIPYLPVKGSVYGEPDGELIKDNQQIIQALTRSMIDIQARGANGQMGRPKGYLDTINAQKFNKGEDYEYNPSGVHPSEAFYMHTVNEVPASVMALLNQQYADAEASTGVKSFQGGIDGNAYGQVAAGMSQAITALTQREGDILYRLSKGLEKVGNKILAMNALWLKPEEMIAITDNEFVTIKRDELAGDFFLNVNIKSTSESEGKAQQLTFIAQTLGSDADWGLRKIFIQEICRLYNLDSMLNAIQKYEPQPDPMAEQMQQLQMQELQAKIDKLTAEAEYFRARGDFVEAQVDDVQAATDQKSLDFLEQQDGTKHQRNMETIQAQAYAQNQGKVAQELIKGDNAVRAAKARGESQPTNKKSGKNKPRVESGTGRTMLNIPSPRRSIMSYKTPAAEPSIPKSGV